MKKIIQAKIALSMEFEIEVPDNASNDEIWEKSEDFIEECTISDGDIINIAETDILDIVDPY